MTGTLTGVNDKGCSVAMNVTSYGISGGWVNKLDGIPSMFYNRLLLETCTTFKETQKFINSHHPLGPYHQAVTDHTKAATFSLDQSKDWTLRWPIDSLSGYKVRMLDSDTSLITTNCSFNPKQHDMFKGGRRKNAIVQYLRKTGRVADKKSILKMTQPISLVNNQFTTHRVILGKKNA